MYLPCVAEARQTFCQTAETGMTGRTNQLCSSAVRSDQETRVLNVKAMKLSCFFGGDFFRHFALV